LRGFISPKWELKNPVSIDGRNLSEFIDV
jgi:hypothetical protein